MGVNDVGMPFRDRTRLSVRLAATGLISAFGLVFFLLNARHLLAGPGSAPAVVLALLGAVLGLVLGGAGMGLFRSEFTARQLARIAGWAALGTVLLGLVLVLIAMTGVGLEAPAAATLLSVSTFAHVLIGLRDVQRIRATELARKREKLSVLNRLVRHNLRHEAQQLLGAKAALEGERDEGVIDTVGTVAAELSEMHERLERSQSLLSERPPGGSQVDIAGIVESVVEPYREAATDLTFTIETDSTVQVRAGAEVESALEELLENAVAHAHSSVGIEVRRTGSTVTVAVEDDGPGMPEAERAVIMREADIDQLSHSQGLGLWFVRWVMDTYDGSIEIDSDDGGTRVELGFPA